MINEVTMYYVDCDNCGKSQGEFSDYAAWSDAITADDMARNSDDFIKEGDKYYCRECYSYDDNENLIIKKLP